MIEYNDDNNKKQKKISKKITKTETDIDKKDSKLKFIEVCSGAGGLSSGFITENFIPILLNDSDKTCCNTLKKNHSDVDIKQGSFVDIDFDEYINKDIDVFMGGVPCQSFSHAGKRLGLDDERGNLLLEFIKIVNKINPKVFLIENVKGLVTHDKGETLKKIINSINDLNKYKVYHKVLNANDYGVAQKRERLIIIGIRNDITKIYEFPSPDIKKLVLKDVLQNIPDSEGYEYSDEKKKIMDLVPQGGCWIDLPIETQKIYMKGCFHSGGGKRGIARRLSLDSPSLTLTTSPCQKQTERCHPTQTRPLNIKEYMRIQSFPDDYIFTGSIAQKYKQIGNAVPVKFAQKIAQSIKKLLSN